MLCGRCIINFITSLCIVWYHDCYSFFTTRGLSLNAVLQCYNDAKPTLLCLDCNVTKTILSMKKID